MASLPKRRVCVWLLRRLFNDGDYVERGRRGELVVHVATTNRSGPSEPRGTRTQSVRYLTPAGQLVAVAIQFRRRDGSLGGSGLPDPKYLLIEGVVLVPGHGDREACPECHLHRATRA